MPKIDHAVTEAYADGGLLSCAPTTHGLTWAWRYVSRVECPGGCRLVEPFVDGKRRVYEDYGPDSKWVVCRDCGGKGSDKIVASASGVLTCTELGMATCENNLAETLALLFALEALPDGWAGTALSDNKNAIMRLTGKSTKMTGVPKVYVERIKVAMARLGRFKTVLLKGHPTKIDLQRGRHKSNKPVSVHNVACDAACTRRVERWWRKRNAVRIDYEAVI
jgi:hypothetical protein